MTDEHDAAAEPDPSDGPGDEPVNPEKPGFGAGAGAADVPARRRGRRRRKRLRKKAPWWELPALIGLAIVIAIIVKTFLIQPFYIPSGSMEQTLYGATEGGDRILVNKLIYDIRDPHPGDIVVFGAPPGWDELATKPPSNVLLRGLHWFGQLVGFVPPDGEVLVKRVIATGGQTVEGNADGDVVVTDTNGKKHTLNEPYVYEDQTDARKTFGPVKVPAGRLWVMGDHRNASQDSRYHCGTDGGDDSDFGASCDPRGSTIPIDKVIGKAFVVAWPVSHWRTLGTPPTFDGLGLGAPLEPAALGAVAVLPLWRVRRRRAHDRSA